jgi:hypothetical protein
MSHREHVTQTVFIDLVLDNGELVRIECPSRHEDALHEALDYTRKRRDWWSPAMFDGCHVEYMGHAMRRINMSRVVGML